jgi:hypothetical protein
MTDFITGLTALFGLFWTQVGNATTFLTTNTIGIVLLFTMIASVIIDLIILMVTLKRNRSEE